MICRMTVDHKALGFTLTTSDAAYVLGKTEHEVHDIARSGLLPFLVKREPGEPKRMWFHPDDVSGVEVRLRASAQQNGLLVDDRNRLRVQAALRAYLKAMPPVASYDQALLDNAPLLGKSRQRAEVVHVRPEAVAAFGSTLDNVPVTVSMVTQALEFFGAIRVRGVTALAEPGKQRWGAWFRLPPGFAVDDDDEPEVVDGVVSGAFEQGDTITRRGMGAPHLAEPLQGLDDLDDAHID